MCNIFELLVSSFLVCTPNAGQIQFEFLSLMLSVTFSERSMVLGSPEERPHQWLLAKTWKCGIYFVNES